MFQHPVEGTGKVVQILGPMGRKVGRFQHSSCVFPRAPHLEARTGTMGKAACRPSLLNLPRRDTAYLPNGWLYEVGSVLSGNPPSTLPPIHRGVTTMLEWAVW